MLSVMEIRWGLVPDMGAFVLARGLVRDDMLRELVYTGRKVMAGEAAMIGLVTQVAPDAHSVAIGMARDIAMRNPGAIRQAKRLMALMPEADAAAILRAESEAQAGLLGAPNQREAVTAEMEKRVPRFRD
jgi:enoyl-CoA hydratase/carnithine racemase